MAPTKGEAVSGDETKENEFDFRVHAAEQAGRPYGPSRQSSHFASPCSRV